MSSIILYAIPVFIAAILLELFWARRRGLAIYETRDSLACLAMGLGNVLVAAAVKTFTFGALMWAYQYRVFSFDAGVWWHWALLIVAEDFCYYWFHRLHHEVRCLWAAHVNHHSSRRFNLAVALRQSWTTPLTGFWFWMPLALLGFHPAMILTAKAISLLYQFWIHTEAIGELGPLEWVMNTPSHHRVHHGRNPQYLDRNYGGIFIVWDRLFGTFEPEREKVDYGLVHNIDTYNPVKIAFHEWAAIARDLWRPPPGLARWRALFGSPAELG